MEETNTTTPNMVRSKPKLAFFAFRYDSHLPEFIVTHHREHVRCLSEFFEVTVVNQDCDYQEMCDKYTPDIAVFESGQNILTCRRPLVRNVHSCSQVPKVALFNADAWSETRSGILSDMEQLGIDTFFSISVTAAEHMPGIADSLFCWPNFIDDDLYRDYGVPKLIPVLLTGAKDSQYPWRQSVYKLLSQYYPYLSCPHHGYYARSATGRLLHGEQYAKALNASLIAPVCGTIAKELVRKHFEIPGCRACLITDDSPAVRAAGFVDMKTCVFADESDVLDKVAHLFQHTDELEAITNAGHQLVHSRHTRKQRDQILQWFTLHANIRSDQRIVQSGPFSSLRVVSKTSCVRNGYLISNGLHLVLLRQAHEQLLAGKYEQAEVSYLKCLSYMQSLPEAQLGLAICSLHRGNPERAKCMSFELIQYTLDEYKACEPDPVEWAYYIICLLCLGKVSEAGRRSVEFPRLRHPELDRTRWAVKVLEHKTETASVLADDSPKHRLSIHQLPDLGAEEWTQRLCDMLRACRQYGLVEALTGNKLLRKAIACQGSSMLSEANKSSAEYDLNHEEVMHSTRRREGLTGSFGGKLMVYKFRRRLRKLRKLALAAYLAVSTTRSRALSARHDEDFRRLIHDLMREEQIRSILIVGGGLKKASIEALLTSAFENRRQPSVFCIGGPRTRFGSLRRAVEDDRATWYRLPCSSGESIAAQVEATIQQIKADNQINVFDVLFIDGSELGSGLAAGSVLNQELSEGLIVLLEDMNDAFNCENYNRLVNDQKYELVDHNTSPDRSYAIFRKARAGGQLGDAPYWASTLAE